MGTRTRLSVAVLAILTLAACTDGHVEFPVTVEAQSSLGPEVEVIALNAGNIASFTKRSDVPRPTRLPALEGWNYRVGVGDVLSIIVFDHPELTLPAGPQRSAEESGFRVQVDGTFNYPFVGAIEARDKAPEEIREDLSARLAQYIPNPQIDVRVAAFNSQAVTVAGEIRTPNRLPLTTVPLRLLDAVAAAGGMTEIGDPAQIAVKRDGINYPVNLEGFLETGVSQNNPILRDGDVVTVPRRLAREAFLLGQVDQPAPIDLSLEPITLTQALARQGGLQERRADARGVFVFRANAAKPGMTVFQLDASSPSALLLGTRFLLQPNDVVYVTRAPLSRWNDVISDLLPSINVVGRIDEIGNE